MTNRISVLLAATLFVLAAGGVLTWRLFAWHQRGLVGAHYSVVKTETPVPPILAAYVPQPGQVVSIVPGSPAARAGIAAGDEIVAVDGVPIIEARGEKRHRGDVVRYEIKGRGEVEVRSVSPFQVPIVIVNALANFLVALAFALTGVLVYWFNPRARAARVFVVLCAFAAAGFSLGAIVEIEISALGYGQIGVPGGMVAIYAAYAALAIITANLLLHFSLIFPKPLPILERYPRLLIWIHTLPFVWVASVLSAVPLKQIARATNHAVAASLVIAGLLAVAVTIVMRRKRGVRVADQPWLVELGIVLLFNAFLYTLRSVLGESSAWAIGMVVGIGTALLHIGQILIVSLLTIAALVEGYRRSSLEEKRQVRWPLWGTLVSISASIFFSIAVFVLLRWFPPHSPLVVGSGLLLRVAYILIPISFAFGILKYRVMEIDVIIRKTVPYSIVTGVIIALLFAAVAGAGSFLTGALGIENQTLTILTTLVLVALFVPIHTRLQRAVTRKFLQRGVDLDEAAKTLSAEVMRAGDLAQFLVRAVEIVQQAISARSLVVLVREHDADSFTTAQSIGLPEHQVRNLAIDVAALRGAADVASLADLRLTDGERAALRRAGTTLVVPLSIRGQIVGAMLAGPRLAGTYDEDEQRFLRSAAGQVALGIESLSVSAEEMDLERALEIQRALLPRRLPQIEGLELESRWVPARTVAGDYFDAFKVGDQLALCIADVAGKGMPAALLMATLQAAVRATVREGLEPHEVCSRVASVVTATLDGGRFISFFFGLADVQRGTMRYTNAGHNPPILLRSSGAIERLEEGGPVFARLMRDATYETRDVALTDGDRLVLFTDGATEVRNGENEEFGEERLISSAGRGQTAGQMIETIVANIARFSAGLAVDDLTLVCARVTGSRS